MLSEDFFGGFEYINLSFQNLHMLDGFVTYIAQ